MLCPTVAVRTPDDGVHTRQLLEVEDGDSSLPVSHRHIRDGLFLRWGVPAGVSRVVVLPRCGTTRGRPTWARPCAYEKVGFDSPLRPDHCPTMAGEDNDSPGYHDKGRLFAIGYLKGLRDQYHSMRRAGE